MKRVIERNNSVYGTTQDVRSVPVNVLDVDALLSVGFGTVYHRKQTSDHEIVDVNYFAEIEAELQLTEAATDLFLVVKQRKNAFSAVHEFLRAAEEVGVAAETAVRWLSALFEAAEEELRLFSN